MRIFIILAILLLTACKTTHTVDYIEKEVPIVNTKVEYKDRLVYDSIYIHDSIHIKSINDTIVIYKEKTGIKYLYKSDTIIKTDTIKVPITIKQEHKQTTVINESPLKKYKIWFICLGFVLIFMTYKYYNTRK